MSEVSKGNGARLACDVQPHYVAEFRSMATNEARIRAPLYTKECRKSNCSESWRQRLSQIADLQNLQDCDVFVFRRSSRLTLEERKMHNNDLNLIEK